MNKKELLQRLGELARRSYYFYRATFSVELREKSIEAFQFYSTVYLEFAT